MTIEDIKKIQQAQLYIMDDIHRVCIEHGLDYYMIGGTALGSIRHKGFIPWDVDIDIAMPRDDYEKFVTIYSKELIPALTCHDYRTDKDFYNPHAIVCLNESKIINNSSLLNSGGGYGSYGIYVDILPLDIVPDSQKEREVHKRKLKRIQLLRSLKLCLVLEGDSKFKIMVRRLLRVIIPFSVNYYNRKQQKVAQMYNDELNKDAKCLCSTLSHYSYDKLCVRKDVWATPKLFDFEGRMYYGASDIESYLKQLFGDYMKLPPLEQQTRWMNFVKYAEWTINGIKHCVGEK